MANICFGFANLIGAGSLTASSQVASLPVTNLTTDQGGRSQSWRTSSAAGGNLTLTFSSAQTVQAVSFHRGNFSSTATWSVQLSLSGNVVASYGGSGNTRPCNAVGGQVVYVFPSAVSCDKVVVSLSEPNGNPEGFLSVGLAYIGPVWQPARNFATSSTMGRTSIVGEITSINGTEYPQFRNQQRTASISHQSLGLDEAATLDGLYAVAETGANILIVPDPASPLINSRAIFGRVTPGDITSPYGGAPRAASTMTIKERL